MSLLIQIFLRSPYMTTETHKFDKEQLIYLEQIENQLKMFLSPENVSNVMKSIYSTAEAYIEDNPSTTIDDFKDYIRIDDFLSDWVDCTPTDSVIEKIDSKIVCKKIFIIIALLVFILIMIKLLHLEIINWLVDKQL